MAKYDVGHHFSRRLHREMSLELGIRSKCMYIKGSKRERTSLKRERTSLKRSMCEHFTYLTLKIGRETVCTSVSVTRIQKCFQVDLINYATTQLSIRGRILPSFEANISRTVKQFPVYGTQDLSLLAQQTATCSSPRTQSIRNTSSQPISLTSIFILASNLPLILPSSLLTQFPKPKSKDLLFVTLRATFPAQLILLI